VNRGRFLPRRYRQAGQGTIEFQITAFLLLIPLLMGILQMGLLIMAKNTLNVATLGAARAGAASGGSRAAMEDALALGLAPMHVSGAKALIGAGTGDITAGNYALVVAAALASSKATNLLWSKITVLNPTSKSFTDFGVAKGSDVVIPVTNVFDNDQVGPQSGQTRADALLLKIEVRYCQKMEIKIIDKIITEVLGNPLFAPAPADLLCYADERMPLVSQAIVRMTVPPARRALLQ
jgi:Flp pilus assembly protein TadG